MTLLAFTIIFELIFLGFIKSTTQYERTTRYRPCVDNSDCANLGHAYACFLYMCYSWEQPNSKDHPGCMNDMDCWKGKGMCKRDEGSKLLTNKGICFHEITSCNKHKDCKVNNKKYGDNSVDSYCCLNHCCPAEYYHAWREWPCHSQFSCQQLGTGTHCCNEHDEIISDDIITKDYPKHKTKCCFQNKEKEELLRQSKTLLLGLHTANMTKVIADLHTQKSTQTATDISTQSVNDFESTQTNPATKDILDTIIEWVSTPTSSPKKEDGKDNQMERTTALDPNSLVADQNVNGNNEEESHNSLKLVTTKENLKSIVSEDNFIPVEKNDNFKNISNKNEVKSSERVTKNSFYYYFLIFLTIIIYICIIIVPFVVVRICYYRRCLSQKRTMVELIEGSILNIVSETELGYGTLHFVSNL